MIGHDKRPALKVLGIVPVLVLTGDRDRVVADSACSDEIASAIRDAELVIKSASTRSEKCFARLWSVEKFDADASYHPMIVLSNLFRRVMQYMGSGLHSWIY